MASCFISAGYSLDCRNASTGGLKEMWILGGSGSTITGWAEDGDENITSISGTGVFYHFELVKQSSSFTETLGVNTQAQSVVFQPTLTVSLPKMDQDLRNVWFDLIKLNNVIAIFRDNNNRYWSYAFENGGLVTEGTLVSGLAYTDLNGATFTIAGGEPNPSQEILVTNNDLSTVLSGITVS
jgi:hypothetical protein